MSAGDLAGEVGDIVGVVDTDRERLRRGLHLKGILVKLLRACGAAPLACLHACPKVSTNLHTDRAHLGEVLRRIVCLLMAELLDCFSCHLHHSNLHRPWA